MENEPINWDTLQQRLDYQFKDISLLQMALTHASYYREKGTNSTQLKPTTAAASTSSIPAPHSDNQRLEYLGDGVLQLVLAHELYQRFPSADEGSLTKARALMANRNALAEQAKILDLGSILIMSNGEEKHGGRNRPNSLADAMEAVIGAIFLDSGYATARLFVARLFADHLQHAEVAPEIDNPKGTLQEILQGRLQPPPEYVQISAEGPEHQKLYAFVVRHHGVELGSGSGPKKRAAEHAAAKAALIRLKELDTQNPGWDKIPLINSAPRRTSSN